MDTQLKAFLDEFNQQSQLISHKFYYLGMAVICAEICKWLDHDTYKDKKPDEIKNEIIKYISQNNFIKECFDKFVLDIENQKKAKEELKEKLMKVEGEENK